MFTVDPEAVDAWSARLSGLADDAHQAAQYADTHLRLDGASWSPAFSNAAAGVEEARAALMASADRLHELLGTSAGELARSAELYRSTDRVAAARLDALMDGPTGADHTPVSTVPSTRSGSVGDNPGAALQPPRAHDPIPDPLEAVLGIADWISPAHLVMELLSVICGSNPVSHVAEHIAGDWTALSTVADACRKLADFDAAMGATISGSAEVVLGGSGGWRGEAAGAADAYFAGLARSVDQQWAPVESFGRQCQALAAQTYAYCKGIEDLLKFLVDLAISMVISAAAAAFPLVGTIVAGVAGAVVVARAVRTWESILDIINDLFGAAKLLVGAAGSFAGSLRELSEYRLPAGAYDHPGV